MQSAIALITLFLLSAHANAADSEKETRALVSLVKDAADVLRAKGEDAFTDFRRPGSRWRQKETYIFVLDLKGNMLVHPDPALDGKNVIDLKDVNGKSIIRGLIETAIALPDKPEGWYHYEWPVPGGLLPRWKSSYVRVVAAPSGQNYVVGSGVYNDRMEKSFVVDLVNDAAGAIEKNGNGAFPSFRDPRGRFMAKDAYIFVIDPTGIDLVNPAFPNLEGRNILDVKDTEGKNPIREMLKLAQEKGSGWVNYMWPKPGESVSTQKSAYIRKTKVGDKWLVVGCGVYLANAPKIKRPTGQMTASRLIQLVREGAKILEKRGDGAYPEFRKKGSKWFRDDTYFFVWNMNGTRMFHAADPSLEGRDGRIAKDIHGRPYGKMFLEVAKSSVGEGWVHYMYPEPQSIFPAWKSAFLKRVTFPDGKQHLIASAIYNMQLDEVLVTDLVDRAATLIERQGKAAFGKLRDRTGPFVFMDTYVFVDAPDGTELVNAGQPSLEGKNLMDMKDINGKTVTREYISEAMKNGRAWTNYYWYKPGDNTPARKRTYVRKVQAGQDTYIVGSGIYTEVSRP